LVLADEPTGALDSQSGDEILQLLGELNRSEGTTIAVVTHDRRVAQSTQRILRMQDGRIVEDHHVNDPLEEDLRALAFSKLGETILDLNDAPLQEVTPDEEAILRKLIVRLRR
jgi:ABC-type methionine transport system ATPase subunit